MDARDIILPEPRRLQTCHTFRMGPRGPQTAQIKHRRLQRSLNRGVIQFGIMGQGHDRRARVQPHSLQRLIGPIVRNHRVGEPLGRSKGGPRVHQRHVIAAGACHRQQVLRDMHPADDDHPQGRVVNGHERAPIRFNARPVQTEPVGIGGRPLQPTRLTDQISHIGHGVACRAPVGQVLQHRHGHGPAHRLDHHTDLPAAGQPHGKGFIIADAVVQQPRAPVFHGLQRLDNHSTLNAAARDGAFHPPLPVNHQLRSHRTRRRPPGFNDRGHSHRTTGAVPLQRPPGQTAPVAQLLS